MLLRNTLATFGLALASTAIAQNGTVEFRVRELTGQTAVFGNGDGVLDFTVEARVLNTATRALGDWNFNIRIVGEPEGPASGTLARLRINSGDGSYYTGAPTTSTTGGGIAGTAGQYRYLVGLSAAFNGVINTNTGTFTNGPDHEIGLITGSARGGWLANTGLIVVDGQGNLVPATGADYQTALNAFFGANGNFVELYRFRYTVSNRTPRALVFRVESPTASTFEELVPAGTDWAANTTGGAAITQATDLVIPVTDGNDNCSSIAPNFQYTGIGFQVSASNSGANTDGFAVVAGGVGGCAPSNPLVAPVSVSDVWFRFTPSESDPYTISLCDTASAWNTVLSVHTACPDSLSGYTLACNDDSSCVGIGLSRLDNVPLAAGVPYLIRVAKSGSTPGGQGFTLSVVGPPRGSCCTTTGACSITKQIDCLQAWTLDGVCAPNVCPTTAQIDLNGSGRGTVAVIGSQSSCTTIPGTPTSCQFVAPNGTLVQLSATANPDSTFVGWSGPCNGAGTCEFALTQSAIVTATFRCNVEYDDVPGIQVGDIFAFLNAWFARQPNADFNGFNGINVADVFDYLNSWHRQCRF